MKSSRFEGVRPQREAGDSEHGPVRIKQGPQDFGGFRDGNVLVAKATAPAWTPLFARAAGVVTDGGSLGAHASRVTREYGIPVVATGNATYACIQDNW